MKIIRAYELKRWDVFRKQGAIFLVLRIINGEIVYTNYDQNKGTYTGHCGVIGAKSQERIEVIGVKQKKKKTKPINEYKAGYDPTKKIKWQPPDGAKMRSPRLSDIIHYNKV